LVPVIFFVRCSYRKPPGAQTAPNAAQCTAAQARVTAGSDFDSALFSGAPAVRGARGRFPAYQPRPGALAACSLTEDRNMSNPKLLRALAIGSLALGACSKQGSAPEPETSYSAAETTTTETSVYPTTASAPEQPVESDIQPTPIASGAEQPAAPAAAPSALTDAQILKVAETVDQGEIEQAKEAQKKAKNADVKKLASHMIQQHTKSKQKGASLAKKTQLKPEDSTVASDLSTAAEGTLQTLRACPPGELDRTYVDAQIKQHEGVLELLNTRLIPSASNAELKAQLEETRGMVERHIEEARKIQQALSDTNAGAQPPAG
jgi:putative membrane protein